MIVEKHDEIYVLRDDLVAGGTKTIYLDYLFELYDEVVYASPAYGGAQLALAYCARKHNKQATIFVAKRKKPHARTLEAKKVGARVFQVPNGYLSHVQYRAKQYCNDTGAHLMKFGGYSETAINKIAEYASNVENKYGSFDEIWCASGSGTLINGLQQGFSNAAFNVVQVGAELKNVTNANIYKYHKPFEQECKTKPPFPSCQNYDSKAWEYCKKYSKGEKILFWNVMGKSPTVHLNKI